MIRSGAKYQEVLREHLKIYKKLLGMFSFFSRPEIENFQSEKTLQIEISRDEQLLNVIERMEKFRCDDSDDE